MVNIIAILFDTIQTERRSAMHNKEKIIEQITELLDKLKYTEVLAIYKAICKLIGIKAI